KQDYAKSYKSLEKQEKDIIENIGKVIDFPILVKAKNDELEAIKVEKTKIENKSNEVVSTTSLDKFLYYSKQVITHLDKLALQKERPDLINIAFEVIYGGQIEYEKMNDHTLFLPNFSSTLSQQKNLQNGDFPSNLKWQAH
ncbi:hypothetical protein LR010_02305, partial [Candidatus Gracilibacteria bacterium]|nr:hypothetical protein [Candidatus Gracilibacteria bacterium]